MIYSWYRFLKKRFDILEQKYSNETRRRYFAQNGINGDLRTLNIPLTVKIYANSNLHVGGGITLNEHCVIDACDSYGIYIGDNLLAAQDVYIRGGNHDYSFSELPFQQRGHCAKKIQFDGKMYSIVIEDNVWIGRGATILSGAHIGQGSVIGAGAVVKEYIPEYSIVVGNPARIVSNRRKYPNFEHRKDIGLFD